VDVVGGITRGGHAGRHIVWDWNGTLFDDVDAVLRATNESLAVLGLGPFTLEAYRALFRMPVPAFYERVLGYLPEGHEWELIDTTYHRAYHRYRDACQLSVGVLELLRSWQDGGGTQSLLSMYAHTDLVPLIDRLGLRGHFLRVDGRDGPSTDVKHRYLVRHLTMLDVPPETVTVIGDSADDAAAAFAAGARAVLYTGGFHDRASLVATGAPVVDDLAAAVELAAA
jgi:phosphoglycolate phosphatase-like HAD superfamily hydrolase